ncbi:hypothetical protein U9M48_037181 [Paspalum notatum var. saurae]|uniref:Uncharacterized protein n=1 Tax=Paspalum notatum var. saurae TaxID=547442 RepID=A0AAQ3UEE9_PASNO
MAERHGAGPDTARLFLPPCRGLLARGSHCGGGRQISPAMTLGSGLLARGSLCMTRICPIQAPGRSRAACSLAPLSALLPPPI